MADIKSLTFDDLPSANPRAGSLGTLSFNDLPSGPADPGVLSAIGLGFGRSMDKLVQGVRQGVYAAGTLLPGRAGDTAQALLDDQKATQTFRDQGYAPLQDQHPLATVAGEAAPYVVMPMGASVRGAMALGALPGLISYGTPQEKLIGGGSGAAGSALGYGVGKVVGSAISPGMTAPSSETARLAQVAQQNGIKLDAAQLTQNPVLQNIKASLATMPWTASQQAAKAAEQQGAFNSAALKFAGGDASSATPDAMSDIYSNIIAKKNAAATGVNLTLDEPALNKLADVEANHLRRIPTDQKPVIGSYINDILGMSDNPMPGDVYVKTRSALGQIANGTDNIDLREGAKGLQGVLDDMFDRQATPGAVSQMRDFRSQYSKYMTISDAMQKARSGADVPPKQLYAQAQQDVPGFERNTGDFVNLVRAGRQFLPDPIANSGTPQRQIYNNILSAGSLAGVGAVGGALTPDQKGERHPLTGALMGLGGFGLSHGLGFTTTRAAAAAMNSDWLPKYLMSNALTDAQKLAIAKGGGLLGYSGAMTAPGLLGVQ